MSHRASQRASRWFAHMVLGCAAVVAALANVACEDFIVHYVPPVHDEAVLAIRDVVVHDLPRGALAYNASVARHSGSLYMAFRIDAKASHGTNMQVAVVRLHDDYSVAGPYSILETRRLGVARWTAEDPRLFSMGDSMWVVFNSTADGTMESPRHIHLGRIEQVGADFYLASFAELLMPAPEITGPIEKNWSPFVHDGAIHLVHTTNPHRVVRVPPVALQLGVPSIVVEEVAKSKERIDYRFGAMRGGTPALLDEDLGGYVSVFHTRTVADFNHGAKEHYLMGLYAFAPTPPFEIQAVAPYPLWITTLYKNHNLARHIAFPEGLVIDDDVMHVSFGRDDRSIGVVTLDKDRVLLELREPSNLY